MTAFQFTAAGNRLHRWVLGVLIVISAKFGVIRRRLHLQDAVDDAEDAHPAGPIQLPTSENDPVISKTLGAKFQNDRLSPHVCRLGNVQNKRGTGPSTAEGGPGSDGGGLVRVRLLLSSEH